VVGRFCNAAPRAGNGTLSAAARVSLTAIGRILMSDVDWDQVREWDERYVYHVLATREEYDSLPVASAEGCYVTLADGRRIFDFANQLVCVNMGHRHPKIQQAIREATEKFGYVWEGMTTESRSRAAKLIMEDMDVGEWAGRIRFLATGTEAVENM